MSAIRITAEELNKKTEIRKLEPNTRYDIKEIKAIKTKTGKSYILIDTKGNAYCPPRRVALDNKTTLKLFRSFGRKNIITKTMRFL